MAHPEKTGPRNPPGPGLPSPDELQKLRFRSDLITGIVLFVMGIVGTVLNMMSVTEQEFVRQAAQLFRQFELGEYHRPGGLAAIAWPAIVAHVLNYAVWLFVAVRRWNAGKRAVWCAFAGAVIALGVSSIALALGLAAHPELVHYFSGLPVPGATPSPTPPGG